MTDKAFRRWLTSLVPTLLLVTACSQPINGTPTAAPGGDNRPSSTERTSTNETDTNDTDTNEADTEEAGLEPLVGTWEGRYTCAQGVTGLKLSIEPVDDETVRALFEFFPVPENADTLEGSYQLLGAYRGNRLVFRQEKWIKQPENYLMVDLEVTSPVEPDMNVLSGNVLSPDCKGFSVSRTD